MVRDSITKIKNGRAAGPKRVVLQMVKVAGKAGTDTITHPIRL